MDKAHFGLNTHIFLSAEMDGNEEKESLEFQRLILFVLNLLICLSHAPHFPL